MSETHDPDGLRAVLANALGITGRVRKLRKVFTVNGVEVHLDQVEGIGAFIELEVEFGAHLSEEAATAKTLEAFDYFNLEAKDLVSEAYTDLLDPRF
ncbi:CYTH domain-containing protein [Pseudomonas asuensis]|uniref:CYTH domain-containing protein n=1 Tax=Pseudomonas asuensis TaxID=1825787 RepID=A0ABQ2GWS9_9PSED|nr:CYTH domain-containing protein [Pseudomonas asuensis]GGM17321.1 hypothetical protein GCM10009425_30400 [Pseudomonas asuensis]